MIAVHSQLALQGLLVVLDITFWILAFVLLDFLSLFSNPAAQIAYIVTTLGGLYRVATGEYSRVRARDTFATDTASDDEYDMAYVSRANDYNPGQHLVSPGDSAEQIYDQQEPAPRQQQQLAFAPAGYPPKRQFSLLTLALFACLIVAASYGSKVLHLVLAQNISPSVEIVEWPAAYASRAHLDAASDLSTLIPADFDINTRWPRDQIMYNLNVNYSALQQAEDAMPGVAQNETNFARSFYILLTHLFSYDTVDNGTTTHHSCGFSDKWVETVIKKGAEVNELTIPAVPFFPQVWCEDSTAANGSEIDFMLPKLESNYFNNPGDNVTMIGIDEANHTIYTSTLLYDTDNYTQFSMTEQNKLYNNTIPRALILDNIETFGCNLSSPAYNALFNGDDSSSKYNTTYNVSQTIDDFLNVYETTGSSACMVFTLKDPQEDTVSLYFSYNRIITCYYSGSHTLTISQARYRSRTLQYTITGDRHSTAWDAAASTSKFFAGVRILPLVINVQTSPFVYGVLGNVLGYSVQGATDTQFSFAGGLVYNVTSVVASLLAVIGLALLLLLLCKVVLFKLPQGIPSYYGLLHQYHQQRFVSPQPVPPRAGGARARAGPDTLPIADIVEKAYEGEGFDERAQRNRIGVLDAAAYRAGVQGQRGGSFWGWVA